MKIAILSESQGDEQGIRILLEAICSPIRAEWHTLRLRHPGVQGLLGGIGITLRGLHYHSDVDGLAVVVDSDDTSAHDSSHDLSQQSAATCRYCTIHRAIQQEQANLKPLPNRAPLKIAIGLAVPAIEAWYRCGVDKHCSEQAFVRQLDGGKSLKTARDDLKREVYGTTRPSTSQEAEQATAAAKRLVQDLASLERQFPNFALLAKSIRSWFGR